MLAALGIGAYKVKKAREDAKKETDLPALSAEQENISTSLLNESISKINADIQNAHSKTQDIISLIGDDPKFKDNTQFTILISKHNFLLFDLLTALTSLSTDYNYAKRFIAERPEANKADFDSMQVNIITVSTDIIRLLNSVLRTLRSAREKEFDSVVKRKLEAMERTTQYRITDLKTIIERFQ